MLVRASPRRLSTRTAIDASTPSIEAVTALATSRNPDASEKLIAMSLPTPSASMIAAPAHALTATPPDVDQQRIAVEADGRRRGFALATPLRGGASRTRTGDLLGAIWASPLRWTRRR